jgi:hypothetical protein
MPDFEMPLKNAIAASALSNTLTGCSPAARALGGGKVQSDSGSGHSGRGGFRSLNVVTWRSRSERAQDAFPPLGVG